MMRLWAGWFTAALDAAAAGSGHHPLLIVLDRKGGPDARTKANRTCRLLYGAGAGSRSGPMRPDCPCGTFPRADLAVLLYQMTETGTGNAAYCADILQAVPTLALTAPGGPQASTAEFLERIGLGRLGPALDGPQHPGRCRRLVLHPGRHPRTLGRRSPGHGPDRTRAARTGWNPGCGWNAST